MARATTDIEDWNLPTANSCCGRIERLVDRFEFSASCRRFQYCLEIAVGIFEVKGAILQRTKLLISYGTIDRRIKISQVPP